MYFERNKMMSSSLVSADLLYSRKLRTLWHALQLLLLLLEISPIYYINVCKSNSFQKNASVKLLPITLIVWIF